MFPPKANMTKMFDHEVVIRRATDADRDGVLDLAALDSAAPLAGDVLVALVGAEPWAAISLDDGRIVADPFRPSADASELLRLRAAHIAPRTIAEPLRRRVLRARRAAA